MRRIYHNDWCAIAVEDDGAYWKVFGRADFVFCGQYELKGRILKMSETRESLVERAKAFVFESTRQAVKKINWEAA